MESNGQSPYYDYNLHKELRTIRARDYTFSKKEMISYRILGVYNSVGEMRVMSNRYINEYASRVFNPLKGEIAVIETSIKTFPIAGKFQDILGSDGEIRSVPMRSNPLKIVSVIVFADEVSWNLFAIQNRKVYGDEGIMTLLN